MKKANQPPKNDLHGVIKRAKAAGINEVIVAFSCGKDSLVALDLCCEHFDRVEAYFMYLVRDLSFQQRVIRQAEDRYGIKIMQIPLWAKSTLYRNGVLRNHTKRSSEVPTVKQIDIDRWLRYKTGIEWIATGELACESLQRIAQFKPTGGFDTKRKRMQPLCWWRPQDTYAYLSYRRIPLPADYFKFFDVSRKQSVRSFGDMYPSSLAMVRDNFPDDFEKICKEFPLARAQVLRHDMEQKRKLRKIEQESTP